MGERAGINSQLNDTTKKFTYFVPRNKAWFDAQIVLPSEIRKLFMNDYRYHVSNISLILQYCIV